MPLSYGAGAMYHWSPQLAEKFTFTSRFGDSVEMFQAQGVYIVLPREVCPVGLGDQRVVGGPAGFQNLFKARSADQDRVVAESLHLLKAGHSHILAAPTGYGKTIIGCALAGYMNVPTLVITTKEDIVEQWVKAAKDVLGLEKTEIGIWRGDHIPIGKKFVVSLVQSVLKGYDRYPKSLYDSFGLVICDEVHRMAADQFSQAMWYLPAKLRLGLSATPWRKDGKDVVFQSHIGTVRVRAELEVMIPKILLHESGWKVPIWSSYGTPKKMPHTPGKTMHVDKLLAASLPRNMVIVDFTLKAKSKDRATMIFSTLTNHLRELERLFLEAGVAKKDIGYYVGSTFYSGDKKSKARQREEAKYKPIILATYAMASEATDIPWLDTCVLATPRADVVQIVGRIRREYPDKKQPIVFDLVDGDSNVFKMYASKRQRWYRMLDATCVWV